MGELEAGLTALQTGNVTDAIAQLEAYLSLANSEAADTLKARMGLVQAYAETGRTSEAIALCRLLEASPHEKVRSWAAGQLLKLAPVQTGFEPLSNHAVKRKKIQRSTPLEVQPETPLTHEELNAVAEPHPVTSFKSAGRAQRWRALNRSSSIRLPLAVFGSAVTLFAILYALAAIVVAIPWIWFTIAIRLGQSAEIPSSIVPVWLLLGGLVALFFASPWLIDAVLKWLYEARSLSTASLARYSPEAHRLIQRFAAQQKISIPQLSLLPSAAPIAFTYGYLRKSARIVVSQGLLDRLADDEIAAIYAGELSQIANSSFAGLSLIAAVLQIPYSLYRQCAIVSDTLCGYKLAHPILAKLLVIAIDLITVVSTIGYGFFWVFRGSGIWLAKQRILESDRAACELTGNPNGLARALIKLTIATAETIQKEQQTNDLFESFELLSPIGYRSAITVGSLIDRIPLNGLVQWDLTNPARHWLAINNSHPLIGDRIAQLMQYSHQWQLEPEFELAPLRSTRIHYLRQALPWIGTAIGALLALLFWLIAQSLYLFGNYRFNWIASDYSLFSSFMLIGFGLGTIARFNQFFPELQGVEADLLKLVTAPDLVPIHSPAIRLEGTLIGRSGAKNRLAQDLILQTETGLIKLHFCSQFGPIGNLLQPINLTDQAVVITGWFRRGATPWIDVDTIKASKRPILRAGHQIWSILIAIAAILLGLALIL